MSNIADTIETVSIFNRTALWHGVWRLHHVAKRAVDAGLAPPDGIVVLCAYGEDPATGAKLSGGVHAFRIGEDGQMLNCAMSYAAAPGYNVYIHQAIMRPDLPVGKRGGDADIVCLLAAVLDEDADKNELVTPIVQPDFILETSAGNRQLFYLFDHALTVDEARPLLAALVNACGGDEASKKPAQVFRVAGALNWPSKSKTHPKNKTRNPRSPHPQPVRELKSWDGSSYTNVDNLRTLLASHWEAPEAERKPKSRSTREAPTITRFLGRYNFDACLQLFKDCRAYSDRDPADDQLQGAYKERHPDATPNDLQPASLNSYRTWETFAFAAGFEFGTAGRALIDAASYDPAGMDGGKFETFCRDPAPGRAVVTIESVTSWAWKRGIGRKIPETGAYIFRDLVNGTYTPPPPGDDLPPAPPPSTDWSEDDCGYGEGESTTLPSRAVNAASLAGKPVPERDWYVPDFIPARNVTLLYADGGTGKSLIALQLSAAGATSTLWLGHPVKPGRVLFMTAEDSQEELHIRLADIERECGIPLSAMGALELVSYADDNMILAALTQGKLGRTALYEEIDGLCAVAKPTLVILDTAADVFDGDEIKRAQVRQFVAMLRRLCIRHGVTIVLLAHPSVSGMQSGTGTSGSTGWSNSVRSRLYFVNVDDDPTGDLRVLRGMKSNYGRKGLEIHMRWRRGVFVPELDATMSGNGDPLIKAAMVDSIFLELVGKYADQGRHVSYKPTSPNYGPKLFVTNPLTKGRGVTKPDLTAAMNRLLDNGKIKIESYGPISDKTSHLIVAQTAVESPPISPE